MSKAGSYVCICDKARRTPDYWSCGIRGKVGRNIIQAVLWNKWSRYRSAKSKEETDVKTCDEITVADLAIVALKCL